MKKNVLKPAKSPMQIAMMSITPDKDRIDTSKLTNRRCDQLGVVGENESCKKIETMSSITGNIVRQSKQTGDRN